MAKKRRAGPRTKSGRLSRAFRGAARDEGTPDLQRHRLALVNGARDPALSASLAGILFAHEVISPAQYAAAQRYRALRAALYGAALTKREPGRPPLEPDYIAKLQRDFDRLVRRLTIEQKWALTNLSLDLRPRWLRAQLLGVPVTAADERERGDLLAALDAIA